jgi:hypothetical protein
MIKFHFDFILPSTPSMNRWSLPFRSYNYNFICISQFSHVCHMTQKPNPHSNIWYNLQSMKLLPVTCSPTIETFSSAPSVYVLPTMRYQFSHPYNIHIHIKSLTKDCKLNSTIDFLNLICVYLLRGYNFYLLMPFPNIYTLPHFLRIYNGTLSRTYYILYIHKLQYAH